METQITKQSLSVCCARLHETLTNFAPCQPVVVQWVQVKSHKITTQDSRRRTVLQLNRYASKNGRMEYVATNRIRKRRNVNTNKPLHGGTTGKNTHIKLRNLYSSKLSLALSVMSSRHIWRHRTNMTASAIYLTFFYEKKTKMVPRKINFTSNID